MKRIAIFSTVVILVIAGTLWALETVRPIDLEGTEVNPGSVHTLTSSWQSVGNLTTGVTTPGPTARTAALFNVTDPNNIVLKLPEGANGVRIRLSSTTDGDTTVTDLFIMDDAAESLALSTDHFNRVSTLTWTTGTQTANTATHEFADTLVVTNENWVPTPGTMSPTGNYIAEYRLDGQGGHYIGISGTTVTNTATVEAKVF